ncbi:MAG: DUF4878 domain-containing protein [Chlorobi bacterium]|nr:DUF4878 domain-containing protein [Chlorobiota bacterium]
MIKRSAVFVAFYCAIMAIAGCSLFNTGPSSVVKKFFYSVEAGKTEDAINLLSTETKQMFGGKFNAYIAQQTVDIKKKGGIASIETQESITGDTARVTYTVTYGDGSTEEGKNDLIKQDGKWKMTVSMNK